MAIAVSATPVSCRVIAAGDEVTSNLAAGEEARADWLAIRGWLSQDMQMRGSCVATEGLNAYEHPELVMLNVPACFTVAAEAILTELAHLVMAGASLVGRSTLELDGQQAPFALLAVDETEVPGLSGTAIRVIPLS
jgi:hypothetical protein